MAILYQRDGQGWQGAKRGDFFVNAVGKCFEAIGPAPHVAGSDQWRELPPIDLSPLAKWIKGLPADYAAKRLAWELSRPSPAMRSAWGSDRYEYAVRLWRMAEPYAEMYGPVWPIDEDPKPFDPPEPSPMDKALDEFVRKREAKRGAQWTCGGCGESFPASDDALRAHTDRCEQLPNDKGRALDRAMSKLIPAEMDFPSRLVNAKVVM